MSKASILPYICNPEQAEVVKDLVKATSRSPRKLNDSSGIYVKLNNGGHDFYVRSRLPCDLFIKLQSSK